MALNYKVIKEILKQVEEASPLGIEDENMIICKETNISDEEKRAYLDWLKNEGFIIFNVFGESRDNVKGVAKNIIITENGINKLHK